MHDFRCTNSADMFYSQLAEPVKYYKETEGGRKIMCKAVEELAEKRADERVLEEKRDTAKKLLHNGKLSKEEVADCVGLPIEMIEEIE